MLTHALTVSFSPLQNCVAMLLIFNLSNSTKCSSGKQLVNETPSSRPSQLCQNVCTP